MIGKGFRVWVLIRIQSMFISLKNIVHKVLQSLGSPKPRYKVLIDTGHS